MSTEEASQEFTSEQADSRDPSLNEIIVAQTKDRTDHRYPDVGKWIRLEVPSNVKVTKVSIRRLKS